MTVADRVQSIYQRMENAAVKAGRKIEEITLVGVTKTQPPQAVRQLIQAGVHTIGENRVQEILQKEPFLQDLPHQVHLIGHLQRNKAKFLPGKINMLQSLSSLQTMRALEGALAPFGQVLDVLVEVNIGEEASKNGIAPAAVPELCAQITESPHLRLRGLMAIPPQVQGTAVCSYFNQMYQLFVDIGGKKMDNGNVNILSMGMSSDFEYAIACGSTMLRVGTSLFGPRQYL